MGAEWEQYGDCFGVFIFQIVFFICEGLFNKPNVFCCSLTLKSEDDKKVDKQDSTETDIAAEIVESEETSDAKIVESSETSEENMRSKSW